MAPSDGLRVVARQSKANADKAHVYDYWPCWTR
jgi:hypothetical protein